MPESWRGRAIDKKQGSSSDVMLVHRQMLMNLLVTRRFFTTINSLILKSPEQARLVLPHSMMTEWYWSGTLFALPEFAIYKPDAQYRQIVADQIDNLVSQVAPVSWKELRVKATMKRHRRYMNI